MVTFGPGEIVVKKGETSVALSVQVSGHARVLRQGQEVALLGPGKHFGEITFLTGHPRGASVVAIGPLEAVELDTRALRLAVQQQPPLVEELAQRWLPAPRSLREGRSLGKLPAPRG